MSIGTAAMSLPISFLDTNGPRFCGFEAQERLKDYRQRHTRWPQHHPCLGMARWAVVMLGPTRAPLAVIFSAFLDLRTPKTRPFGSRNGPETAQERRERRPIFGQAHGQRFS